VRAGSGCREPGQPGGRFTSFQIGPTRHLAYVLIVRQDSRHQRKERWTHAPDDEVASRWRLSDPDADGIEFEIEHEVVLSQDAPTEFSEPLSINGEPVDPIDGGVFLVHWTTDAID